jgi:hypothetical protein
MKKIQVTGEEKKSSGRKPKTTQHEAGPDRAKSGEQAPLANLQQQVGNQAVQRLIAQRQGGPTETDEATASQINQLRGSGQALDGAVQRDMGHKIGADFSGVSVHDSPEADDLNKRLGAKAFTTGQDIFFRQGEYSPESQSGQELLAHELTHVVQQREGATASPAAKMVVNPPDDSYEREADTVARQVTGSAAVQAQEDDELLQGKSIQRAEMPREEELQAMSIQRAPLEEEEPLQGKAIQRAAGLEEEEPLQGKLLQREEMPREEELQAMTLQRQELAEEREEVQMMTAGREDASEDMG